MIQYFRSKLGLGIIEQQATIFRQKALVDDFECENVFYSNEKSGTKNSMGFFIPFLFSGPIAQGMLHWETSWHIIHGLPRRKLFEKIPLP